MGLTIHRPQQDPPSGGLVADRELCLDRRQSRLVEAGSVESAYLLAGKGHVVSAKDVARLGLSVWSNGRVMQGTEPVAADEPAPLAEPGEESEPVVEAPAPIMPPESKRSRKKL